MEIHSIKSKAYSSLYLGMLGIFFLIVLIDSILPVEFMGISKFAMVVTFGGVAWVVFAIKVLPRCPECGKGVFTVLELGKVPVILKSWVGSQCSNCGAKFE